MTQPATSQIALAGADPSTPPATDPPTLGDDIIQGAAQIAVFMGLPLRAVYRLSTEVKPAQRPPFFKLGTNCLCCRKSALLRWIEQQELAHQARGTDQQERNAPQNAVEGVQAVVAG